MVVNCWAEPEAMRASPLFTMSPGLESFRHGVVDNVFHALLLTFLTAAEVQKYSWHSWRIGLACALLATNAPVATILALCRWKGPQSLQIYARRNMHEIAAWVDTAAAQVTNSVQAPNLPGVARSFGDRCGDGVAGRGERSARRFAARDLRATRGARAREPERAHGGRPARATRACRTRPRNRRRRVDAPGRSASRQTLQIL